MVAILTQRILPVLQLTRMAWVFTAVSNSLCSYFLIMAYQARTRDAAMQGIQVWQMMLIVLISFGLYGYGMALNDIVDRRRDRMLGGERPLPSGAMSLVSAYLVCGVFAVVACLGAAAYAVRQPGHGVSSAVIVVGTVAIVSLYDVVGKYLAGVGLLVLGVVRAAHALVPGVGHPVMWHPILLANHAVLTAMVCYALEEKRPLLNRTHVILVIGALLLVDGWALSAGLTGRALGPLLPGSLALDWWLLIPAGAEVLFALVGVYLWERARSRQEAARNLMVTGMLWLIVIDVAFAATFAGWRQATILAVLLPVTYFSVRAMRSAGLVLSLAQKPEFERTRE